MYLKYKKGFISLLIIICMVRIAMKLLFVDINSGFYNSAPIFPTIETILFLFAIIITLVSFAKVKDEGIVELKTNNRTNIVMLIYGLFIFVWSLIKIYDLVSSTSYSVNSIPKPILLVELLFGIVASVSLIVNTLTKVDVRLFLSIPLWHSLFAIDRFITFKQVSTVSDQLLETLFLITSTIFCSKLVDFLGGDNQNRKYTLLFGAESLIIGLPLLFGQLFALFVFGKCSGPSIDSLIILSGDGILISFFIKELVYSQKKF